jgi:hypothetical protein
MPRSRISERQGFAGARNPQRRVNLAGTYVAPEVAVGMKHPKAICARCK